MTALDANNGNIVWRAYSTGPDSDVLIGEVSTVNDDLTDNVFREPIGRVDPFVQLGVGLAVASSTNEREFRDDHQEVGHLGLGAKLALRENWGLRSDFRWLLSPFSANMSTASDFEALLGVYRSFDVLPSQPPAPPKDSDGDGIVDVVDRCPEEPEDADGVADDDGCPDHEPLDTDNDGIADGDDQCPSNPEDKDGFEDADGCPDPPG